MSKIKIKNFGPIKEGYQEYDGWMDIKKVTVFIGNQGSGKSTVAKTISVLSWLEKAINRGDVSKNMHKAKFIEFFLYQRIHNYFTESTYISYYGDKYHIQYDAKQNFPVSIEEVKNGFYLVPKLMYVPAERSFLSSLGNAFEIKELPDNIFYFAVEYKNSQKELSGKKVNLPIKGYSYRYNEDTDTSYVLGEDFQLDLLESSSGFQSLVPLFLVSRRLANIDFFDVEYQRKSLSVTQKIRMDEEISDVILRKQINNIMDKSNEIDIIQAKYYTKCFINIVEEPELNLYPTSQWEILKSLLEYNNLDDGNKLLMTTHSPYIINFLSIAIQGASLRLKIQHEKPNENLNDRLFSIIPKESLVSASEIIIYQLDEKSGSIARLPDFEGIPSDKNYLNQSLRHGNEIFDSLLEIEQEL